MRALVCHEFQNYAKHKVETMDPQPIKPGHVRIAIKAAGVNFPDILMTEGKYQMKPPFPFVPGGEGAGIITEVGQDVTHLKMGDRVACLVMHGTFASEIIAPAMAVAPIGDMPFNIAAGLTLVYGTSYYALKQRAQVMEGETVFIMGAAGGVGLAAVELAKSMGANVIAAASTDEKLAVCKAHGADHLINYSDADIKAEVKALGGCDVVYDPVGDKFAEPAIRTLNWYGRYLVIGFAAGDIPKIPLNLALLKSIDIRGVFWGTWTMKDPKAHMQNMKEIMALYHNGQIKPRVSAEYKLEDFTKAFDDLTQRRAMGKVILTMDDGSL